MKNYALIFLIFIVLSFNITAIKTVLAVNDTYKEGIYTIKELKISPNRVYTFKNISQKNDVRVLVFDEEYGIIQNIKLQANSGEVDIIPIMPNYTIAIAGSGELKLTPKS